MRSTVPVGGGRSPLALGLCRNRTKVYAQTPDCYTRGGVRPQSDRLGRKRFPSRVDVGSGWHGSPASNAFAFLADCSRRTAICLRLCFGLRFVCRLSPCPTLPARLDAPVCLSLCGCRLAWRCTDGLPRHGERWLFTGRRFYCHNCIGARHLFDSRTLVATTNPTCTALGLTNLCRQPEHFVVNFRFMRTSISKVLGGSSPFSLGCMKGFRVAD
jgi:hypothetical protein